MTGEPSPGPVPLRPTGVTPTPVQRWRRGSAQRADDLVAVEAPLEMRLEVAMDGRWQERSIAVTMRTPGHDHELTVGFLFGEGIITSAEQIVAITETAAGAGTDANVVRVQLRPGVAIDWARLERHFYTSSSCGVCGKTAIAAVQAQANPIYLKHAPILPGDLIHPLPTALRQAQSAFEQTGGLHAAALFDAQGNLLDLKEDVGRHNALDKLVGAALLRGDLPWQEQLVLLSGRASFELVQKALMAGLPILAAIGAPSSLAVDLADEFDLTLLGFVREERFNIYSGGWRIQPPVDGP